MLINTQNIKAIIFDLGNVLIPLDWRLSERCFEQYGAVINQDNFKILEEIANVFDKGLIDEAFFRKEFSRIMGITVSDEEFDRCWCKFVLPYPEKYKKMVEQLSQRYDLYVLSNLNSIHYKHIKTFPTWNETVFKKLFLSYQLRTRKPEKKIFQIVKDNIQYKPEEILYFDDKEEFVKKAHEQIAINAVKVQDNNIIELVDRLLCITTTIEK